MYALLEGVFFAFNNELASLVGNTGLLLWLSW